MLRSNAQDRRDFLKPAYGIGVNTAVQTQPPYRHARGIGHGCAPLQSESVLHLLHLLSVIVIPSNRLSNRKLIVKKKTAVLI